MEYSITRKEMLDWCQIPHTELEAHPAKKVKQVVIRQTPDAIMEYLGNLMADEVSENNAKGLPTRWLLPAGPRKQYETFIDRVTKEQISLKNLFVFHMDEWLDWNARPYPYANSHNCLRGNMDAIFYDKIPETLNVPPEQRIWPDLADPDAMDKKVEEVGGFDTVWAGVGYKGLVAFNEAPRDIYYRMTKEEYAQSKTRVVKISDETIVAQSQRKWGGCTELVPPMALTIGFRSMLSTKRVVFMVATGAWKQTVVRVLLFSKGTLEYPATLFTERIPNTILAMDTRTATHPLEDYANNAFREGW